MQCVSILKREGCPRGEETFEETPSNKSMKKNTKERQAKNKYYE